MPNKINIGHDNNFNLIRLLLAASVILSHCWKFVEGDYNNEPLFYLTNHFKIGLVAVDGFFLLSGYLIFASWIRKPQIIDYLKRRILRIFPAFIVVSFISVALGALIYGHELWGYVLRLKVLVDAFSLGEPMGPFSGEQLNVSLWTIRYEFFCYMVVWGMGLVGLLKKKWPLIVLCASSVGIATSGIFDHNPQFRPLVHLVPYFVTGGMFFMFRDKIVYRWHYALIALAGIILGFMHVTLSTILLPVAGGYLLFYVGFFKSPILGKLRPRNDISYGLYLYGWPVQKLIVVSLAIASPWLLFSMALPVAALLGLVSWKIVEEPCIRKIARHRWLFKRRIGAKDVLSGSGN